MGSAGTMSENKVWYQWGYSLSVFELLWQGNVKKVLDTKPSIYTKGFKTPKISKGESDAQDFISRRWSGYSSTGRENALWMGIWSGSGRRLYGSFESICSVGASSSPQGYLFALV